MILSDFSKWLDYHLIRFPDVGSWLATLPEESKKVGNPSRQSVIDAWSELLSKVDLSEARIASDRLFAGDAEAPKTPAGHCTAVFKIADKLRQARPKQPERIDGMEVFRCGICLDTGAVLVYSGKTIAAMRRGDCHHPTLNPTGAPFTWYLASAPCCCGKRRAADGVATYSGDGVEGEGYLRVPYMKTEEQWIYLRDCLATGQALAKPPAPPVGETADECLEANRALIAKCLARAAVATTRHVAKVGTPASDRVAT